MEPGNVTPEVMQPSERSITYGYQLMGRAKDAFVTVHVNGEPYGEVDPTFVSKYSLELGEIWNLMDRHGTHHQVRFNGCLENPLLTDGWIDLRQPFHMIHDHKICFYFLGNSEFYVSHLSGNIPPHEYPTFHSRFPAEQQRPNYPMDLFEVKICPFIELENSLVLPCDLSDHIKRHNFHRLLLQGPLGEPLNCKCVSQGYGEDNIKITMGWRAFCKINKIKPGHKLIFGFHRSHSSNEVHVQVL